MTKFTMSVILHANETFQSKEEAERYAAEWLNRLAEIDDPDTWDDCDWKIEEAN